MEEKNETKVSILTFLLIIAIIAIIVMGIFIYKLSNDKTAEIQKSKELQSQVNSLNETVNDLQGKIDRISETINPSNLKETDETEDDNDIREDDDTEEYKITGEYYLEDAEGDEPFYTFSSNNTVTYGSLWMCSGTYKIKDDTIKISFTKAVDPEGNKAKVKDFNVDESVELTIIDSDNLEDSNGLIYTK